MSDFDKEAERQRLREKFEHDKQKRKETERMSQLLLQGATMTNQHCETCGDPIFRYRGREFCASCESRTQDAAQANAEQTGEQTAGQQTADQQVTDQQTATAPNEPTGQRAGADATATSEDDPAATPSSQESNGVRSSASTVATDTTGTTDEPTRPSETSESAASGVSSLPSTDLESARASLVRTLTRHARRAEELDDPRRVKEHLTVVREAAEALGALDR